MNPTNMYALSALTHVILEWFFVRYTAKEIADIIKVRPNQARRLFAEGRLTIEQQKLLQLEIVKMHHYGTIDNFEECFKGHERRFAKFLAIEKDLHLVEPWARAEVSIQHLSEMFEDYILTKI